MRSSDILPNDQGYEFQEGDTDNFDSVIQDDKTLAPHIASPTETTADIDDELTIRMESLQVSSDEEKSPASKLSASHPMLFNSFSANKSRLNPKRHGSCMLDTKGTSTMRLNELLVLQTTPHTFTKPTLPVIKEEEKPSVTTPTKSPASMPHTFWFESYQQWCGDLKQSDGKIWLDEIAAYKATEKQWLEQNPQWKR